MKGFYEKALESDNKKIGDNNIEDNKLGDYKNEEKNEFERYKEHKPEETQVCGSSLSRGTAVTLISVMAGIVLTIVVVIVITTVKNSSKASSLKSYNVVDNSVSSSNSSIYSEPDGMDDVDSNTQNDDGDFNKDKVEETETPQNDSIVQGQDNEVTSTTEPTSNNSITAGLKKLAQSNSKVNTILANQNKYPERLLEDVIRNPEMIDFTYNYLNMVNKSYTDVIDISNDVSNTHYGMPLFIQWDSRWGYYPYSSGVIGISGCGPTGLSMVYVHLTGDTNWNPLKMAKYSTQSGYVTVGVGTSWELMTSGARTLGLQVEKISKTEATMIAHLQQGNPIIASMGPGIFTDKGHFIVFRKYENGKFYVNDPFCIEHTNRAWSYSEFSGQVKSMWAYWR